MRIESSANLSERQPRGLRPRPRWWVLAAALTALLAVPMQVAGASSPAGQAGGSGSTVVKLGMNYPLTGAVTANPETEAAFNAAIDAFNERGGAGTGGLKLKGVICDNRGDANREVECARELVDEGVVATVNDLTFNNPAGVVDVMEAAGIPRIGLLPTNVAEFGSTVSFPVSAGAIAAYTGCAVGFVENGNKTVTIIRTDAPTGASFRGFVSPMFAAAGAEVTGDIALATGATDYAPYVSELQRADTDAALLSVGSEAATQFIAAMSQLNFKTPMCGAPGTFALDTLRKYKDITKGTLLVESFPYPTPNNAKAFPGLKQYFKDMKASGEEDLEVKNLDVSSFSPWMGTLAFVNATKGLDTFTKESVLETLRTVQDVDLLGLTPPWTPSTPGFSVFKSSSNHFVFISEFNGKNVVSKNEPVDVAQYIS